MIVTITFRSPVNSDGATGRSGPTGVARSLRMGGVHHVGAEILTRDARSPIWSHDPPIQLDLGLDPQLDAQLHIERFGRAFNASEPHEARHPLTPREDALSFTSPLARCQLETGVMPAGSSPHC